MAPPRSSFDDVAYFSSLTSRWLGRTLRTWASCGSTNDQAAAWARATPDAAPHGALVVADAQWQGRGRLGRSWHSPADDNLYYSVVLRPRLPPHRAPPVTLAVAVALAAAVEQAGARPTLKWPNDLLLDGRKVAGILTEMVTAGSRVEFVVVGIGVNLSTLRFPAELSSRATSLARELGHPVPREPFAASLSSELERWYERFEVEGTTPIVAAWKQRAQLFGRRVVVRSGTESLEGVAEDLDSDGTLLLRTDDGALARVSSGEIVQNLEA